MKKIYPVLEFGGGIPLFALAAFLKSSGAGALSAGILLFLAISEAVLFYLESRSIVDIRMLFSLTWLTALGLSCLGLSELQTDWAPVTWVMTGGFYFILCGAFLSVREILRRRENKSVPEAVGTLPPAERGEKLRKSLFRLIAAVFLAGFLSFLAESVVFSFDYPFFSTKPHAYTAFHITGIHYFVVSVIFVHPLSVMFCLLDAPDRREKIFLFSVNALSILMCILILSKFQLLFGLEMSLVTWVLLQKRFSGKQILLFSFLALLLFASGSALMILMRKYPENYLAGIFRFRDSSVPMPFQYVYTYMVNNFENLNLLVTSGVAPTLGRRSVYPFFCLTGAKFLPGAAEFLWVPVYYTVPELTTLTLIYDFYGDFGPSGVLAAAVLLGAVSALVTRLAAERRSVFSVLLYAQILLILFLAFFSTWLSNPTIWFGIALTAGIGVYAERERVMLFLGRK